MKRIVFFALCATAMAAVVSAQAGNGPGLGPAAGTRPGLSEPVTISGNLGISRGMISLESGGSLYYVAGLNRFIGFIDGLKEGAAVSLTGYAFEPPRLSGAKVFRVIELNLNGKRYEMAPPVETEFGNRAQGWDMYSRHRNFRSRNDGPGNWGKGPGCHHRDWDGPDRHGFRRDY
jgi:hypothetical protein